MPPLPELRIAFDPGSSLTKCVYSVNQGKAKLMMMEPDVISLPSSSVAHIQSESLRPEDQAWVQLSRESPDVQICGFLANSFASVERLRLPKSDHALYKLLAAIGVIAQKEGIERFSLQVTMLLPYGEMTSGEGVKGELAESVRKFYFQRKLLRGKLESFGWLVEGSGMIHQVLRNCGWDWFTTHRTVVFMMGYRNLSCITFNRGMAEGEHSSTGNFGFVRLIDRIIARTSGQDRAALIEAIYKIGTDIAVDNVHLRGLIKSERPEKQEAEAKLLAEAIAIARHEYWTNVHTWIESVIPQHIDRLIVSGGTSLYLKSEINQQFAKFDPQWIEIQAEGSLKQIEPVLLFRFADVMSVFEYTFSSMAASA